MRNIFRFLLKHNFFLVFIFLNVVSLLLVLNTDNYNNFRANSSLANITGTVFSVSDNIKGYFNLKNINKKLKEENACLRSKLMSAYRDDDLVSLDTIPLFTLKLEENKIVDSLLLNDTITDSSYMCIAPTHFIVKENYNVYDFKTATIVQNTVNKRNNYILINKGRLDGVEPNMGVVSSKSIVGVVMQVSNHYASVLPLLHSKSRVSAKLMKDSEYGIVEWNGNNYRNASMREIPYHAKIEIGDTIVTSGRSNIYPADIPLGTVKKMSINEGDGFYLIEVELLEDYRKLNSVYVVKNKYKPELDSLKSKFNY